MDGYHLADVELERLGLRQAKGAPDTFDAGGYVALLARLRAADPADAVVYAPAFERTLEQPLAGAIPVPAAARLVVTEGNYLLLDTRALACGARRWWTRCGSARCATTCACTGCTPATSRSARRPTRRWRGSPPSTSRTPR